MTKAELIKKMAEASGLSGRKTEKFVEELFGRIRESVLAGQPVRIARFGAFTPRQLRSTGLRADGSRWERAPKAAVGFKAYAASGSNSSGSKNHVRAKTVAKPAEPSVPVSGSLDRSVDSGFRA